MLLLFEADHKCIPADVDEDNRVVDVEADVPDLNCDPIKIQCVIQFFIIVIFALNLHTSRSVRQNQNRVLPQRNQL